MSDVVSFFRAWLSDPLRVASIVPSSRSLGQAITAEIGPDHAPVLELGPGTGVFTQALLGRGVPQDRLALVEFGDEFASLLAERYPDATVLRMDAARIRRKALFEGEKMGAVVSGLPLLSMPLRKVVGILSGAFLHLREGGSFYQFTYGPNCPVSKRVLDRLGLQSESMGWVCSNVPPAQVFRISRASQPAGAPVPDAAAWRATAEPSLNAAG